MKNTNQYRDGNLIFDSDTYELKFYKRTYYLSRIDVDENSNPQFILSNQEDSDKYKVPSSSFFKGLEEYNAFYNYLKKYNPEIMI